LQHGGLGAWQAPPCASFCAPALGTTVQYCCNKNRHTVYAQTSHACQIPITPSTLLSL
jgi:hypothetical protein